MRLARSAVRPFRLARSGGADIELSLDADPAGEASEIWAAHHAACLLPKSGEGSLRGLFEAAACGRPIIASDVPGCRRFVTDGSEGFLVPPGDPAALAAAFTKLARDPVLLPRMGAAARARVLHGYTERDVTEAVKRLYAAMLDGRS